MSNTNPYATWMNRPDTPKPTPAECHQSMLANEREAARLHGQAVARLHQLPVGDPQLHQARADAHRYYHERRHFRAAASWWADRVKGAVRVPEHDQRLPREPGDDSDELNF